MQEKISVIVPIYNVRPYLNRCMDSLVSQTYNNMEILLIDDCSDDGSEIVAKEYEKRYPQYCRLIQRKVNGGLSAARNTGIDHATGEWLAFVDSDDWVSEDYLDSMIEVGERDGADIVVNCSYFMVYETGKMKEIDPLRDMTTDFSQQEKVARLRFSATAKLIRKDFLDQTKIRFPEDVWRCEDIAVLIPLYTYTEKISVIHKTTYYYYQRKSSLSNRNNRNVDIRFYPKTIGRMVELSSKGFEKELEFRAVSELLYGLVMVMIRSQKEKPEILQQIDSFVKQYPNWKDNHYLTWLPKGKQIFIKLSAGKHLWLLRFLIGCRDLIRK